MIYKLVRVVATIAAGFLLFATLGFDGPNVARAGGTRRVVVSNGRSCISYRNNVLQLNNHAPIQHYSYTQNVQYGNYLVGESLRINAVAVKIADAVEKEMALRWGKRRKNRPTDDNNNDSDTVLPETPDGSDNPDETSDVWYPQGFKALVQNSCISCHSGDELGGGFSLENLATLTKIEKRAMFGAVVTGAMPKDHSALSDDEVKLFDEFAEGKKKDD